MQIISCDICKKKMDNPSSGLLFYIGRHCVCEACKDNIELSIKSTIRNKDPFAMDWYHKLIDDSIDKAVQKGRA